MHKFYFYLVIFLLTIGIPIYNGSWSNLSLVIGCIAAFKFSYDEFIPYREKFANRNFLEQQPTKTQLKKIAKKDNIEVSIRLQREQIILRILETQKERRRPFKLALLCMGVVITVSFAHFLNRYHFKSTIPESIAIPSAQDRITGELCSFYDEYKKEVTIYFGAFTIKYPVSLLKTWPLKLLEDQARGLHLGSDCGNIAVKFKC